MPRLYAAFAIAADCRLRDERYFFPAMICRQTLLHRFSARSRHAYTTASSFRYYFRQLPRCWRATSYWLRQRYNIAELRRAAGVSRRRAAQDVRLTALIVKAFALRHCRRECRYVATWFTLIFLSLRRRRCRAAMAFAASFSPSCRELPGEIATIFSMLAAEARLYTPAFERSTGHAPRC